MGDQAAVAAVEHREVLAEPGGDVVGRQHRDRRGPGQALGPHQADVGPRDRQDARRAVRRRADRADALALRLLGVHAVGGQVRRQVLAHRHRPDARAAAAVRDAERLVQVEVGDVATELTRLGVAEQRVEVGAVDVHLTAVAVHDLAQLGDRVLVGAVGRGVGDHDRGQVVGVRVALLAQVVEVDRAVVGGLHHDHAHARPSPPRRRWCRGPTTGSGRRRGRPRRGPGGRRGWPSARRARPASRRWAGSRRGRSR